MQVFELYFRRLFKRKIMMALMLVLPVAVAYLLVQAFEPSHSLEYANVLNGVIGFLVIITLMNTMQFYGDRQHATDKRILLSTHSKFSYYCQMVAVYLVISTVQLVAVMLFTDIVLAIHLPISILEHIIIVLAYALLNVSAAGLGLLISGCSPSKYVSWLRLLSIGLALVVLGGLLLPSEQLPAIIQNIIMILPTYWLTKVVILLLHDIGDYMYPVAGYLLGLTICAAIIMLLLTRMKSEKI